ncbi:hypothetical protein HPB51_010525 [Rhipicephalus microplus]|uniref:Uncharacterized protein n=2 Tax=Rhipicephalus microplus TaxID=6941 RepID=A0A9J6D9P1_RHIMP|nr:hypothetical protein HPB51_010525 [Rhipicephalus microplus]
MQLGVHNTLDEIIEAQETAQLMRLSSTPAGRKILSILGLSPALVEDHRLQLPNEQRTAIQVSPFPRNVHPQHNLGRRRARAITLLKNIRNDPHSVCFVDAAQYGRSDKSSVISVNHMGSIINAASVRGSTPSRVEQLAVALALWDDSRSQIFTDSRLLHKMAITSVITLSLLVVGALAGSKQDANNYIDTVLRDHLPANVRSLNLDPTHLPGFNFKVDSTGPTNRDLKAQFPSGMLYGLSSVVRRRGDCGVPGWQGSSVTTGCYVSLDSLRLTFDGSVSGYSLLGGKKNVSLDLVVEKTNAFVEATAPFGQQATLKTLTLSGIEFRVNVNKKLELNDKREKKFLKAVRQSASNILLGIVNSSFREALSRSVSKVPLPSP